MKLFLKIFNKRGRIFPSIVQVILTVMILPALCFLLSLLTGGDRAFSMITNLLGELSITEYWVDLLLLLSEDPGSISGMNIYRCSRGIKKPVERWVSEPEAAEIVADATKTFERTYGFETDGFCQTVIKEFYNKARKEEENGTS